MSIMFCPRSSSCLSVLVSRVKRLCRQSLAPPDVTPAGCCCGGVWGPSGSPPRALCGPGPPGARSCGSSGPPSAGRSTGAAGWREAPPEAQDGRTGQWKDFKLFPLIDSFYELRSESKYQHLKVKSRIWKCKNNSWKFVRALFNLT